MPSNLGSIDSMKKRKISPLTIERFDMDMNALQGWIVIGLLAFIVLLLWDIGSRLRDIFADVTQAKDSVVALEDDARLRRREANRES